MRTHDFKDLLAKVRASIPDADERLATLREATLAEMAAYAQVEEAFRSYWHTVGDVAPQADCLPAGPELGSAFQVVRAALGQIGADFSVRVQFADGRELTLIPEDLVAAARRQPQTADHNLDDLALPPMKVLEPVA